MLQILNVDENTYKDAYNFLCSVPSISEVDASILKNGVIVVDNDKVIGSIAFEAYDHNGLVRYFVFKKSLPNSVLVELLNRLEENAKSQDISNLVCVADNVQIEVLFKELSFNRIESNIFINEEMIKNTSFSNSVFLAKSI